MTRPTPRYGINASFVDGEAHVEFEALERFREAYPSDPPGSDFRTVADGRLSVSPLVLPGEYRATQRVATVVADLV